MSKTVTIIVAGVNHKAEEKSFETGSVGYRLGDKITLAAGILGRDLVVKFGPHQEVKLPWRQFSNDAWGWYYSGKLEFHGQLCQVGAKFTVAGSKRKGWQLHTGPAELATNVNLTVIGSKQEGKAAKKAPTPSAAQSVAPAPAPAKLPAADMLPEFPADCPF